ncbi:MAG: hypothetical protein WC873_00745 [Candidatus Gracilibacteria bacterium]
MKTARISALLPSSLVIEIKKASVKENTTQSDIIKQALKDWLKKRLNEDTKALSKMAFDDLPSEDQWNAIQAAI